MTDKAETGRPSADPTGVDVTLPINLGQFLKAAGLVGTGGEAKYVIASGLVRVNGDVDVRRGRKLLPGDVVALGDAEARVVAPAEPTGGQPGSSGSHAPSF